MTRHASLLGPERTTTTTCKNHRRWVHSADEPLPGANEKTQKIVVCRPKLVPSRYSFPGSAMQFCGGNKPAENVGMSAKASQNRFIRTGHRRENPNAIMAGKQSEHNEARKRGLSADNFNLGQLTQPIIPFL